MVLLDGWQVAPDVVEYALVVVMVEYELAEEYDDVGSQVTHEDDDEP